MCFCRICFLDSLWISWAARAFSCPSARSLLARLESMDGPCVSGRRKTSGQQAIAKKKWTRTTHKPDLCCVSIRHWEFSVMKNLPAVCRSCNKKSDERTKTWTREGAERACGNDVWVTITIILRLVETYYQAMAIAKNIWIVKGLLPNFHR